LMLLPEMFATGFSMNIAGIAEDSGAKAQTSAFLASTAREFKIFLLGGLVTHGKEGRGRNQSVVFSPEGTEITRYSKCQPFTLGGESDHYEAGTETVTFDWQGCTVA